MKKGILLSVFAFSVVIMLTSGTEDNNGKAGRTGSPGEVTCLNGCHSSYALNSGGGSVALTSDMVNDEFVPGTTYNMHLTVTHAGVSLFGLGLEALTTTNANAGTLTAGTGTTIKTATISGVSRRSITHTFGGGSGTVGSHTFNFTWKAPAAGGGNVTFYYAGVAANGNNSNNSDYVYTGNHVFTEYVQPSGINDLTNNAAAVKVYPNPVTDNFTFNYNLGSAQEIEAGIYTLNGQLVQQLTTGVRSEGAHSETATLNENIHTGIYLLMLKAEGKTQTQKLIIQ